MKGKKRSEGRHSTQCGVCNHPEREEIEAQWLSGRSSRSLGEEFGLDKMSVTNHAKYYDLEPELRHMLLAIARSGIDALRRKAATAAHANEAIKSLAKLDGAWVDRTELMPPGWKNKNERELEFFATYGRFPQPDELEETVQ